MINFKLLKSQIRKEGKYYTLFPEIPDLFILKQKNSLTGFIKSLINILNIDKEFNTYYTK